MGCCVNWPEVGGAGLAGRRGMRWYAEGVPELPKQVIGDTRHWRCNSDLVLAFITEQLVFSDEHHIMTTDLDRAFNEWLTARGHQAWAAETLRARFDGHEELTAHHVEKRLIRRREGLSRRNEFTKASSRYRAYLGIRFK